MRIIWQNCKSNDYYQVREAISMTVRTLYYSNIELNTGSPLNPQQIKQLVNSNKDKTLVLYFQSVGFNPMNFPLVRLISLPLSLRLVSNN